MENKRGDTKNHPVWSIYDSLRDARYETKYYTAKLERTRRKARDLEILLAIVVPSSAASGLSIWASVYGQVVWGVLVSAASILAIAKPFLGFSEAIQSYASTAERWRAIDSQLSRLRTDIASEQTYGDSMRARYSEIGHSIDVAINSAPIEDPDEKLRISVQSAVNKEIPVVSLFIPEEQAS